MGNFQDAARRQIEAKEDRDRDRITGVNPLRLRGTPLGGTGSRMEQFYQGFDRAHSPEAPDEY